MSHQHCTQLCAALHIDAFRCFYSTLWCGINTTTKIKSHFFKSEGRFRYRRSSEILLSVRWSLGRFGKTYPLKMGPRGCPKTSLANHNSTMPNIPEERRYPITPRHKPEIMQDSFVVHFINLLLLSRYVTSRDFTCYVFTSFPVTNK